MEKKAKPLVVERTFNASPAQIWAALTDPAQMKEWYFDLPGFRAEMGYQFEFMGGPAPERQYLHRCKVLAAEPNRRLAYSWRYEGHTGKSIVEFLLTERVGGKTQVRIEHRGLETFPADVPDLAAANFEVGWTAILGTSLRDFLNR